MEISHFHYITQDLDTVTHFQLVQMAIECGLDWIQIRIKKTNPLEENLDSIVKTCKYAGVTCILNDYVELAKEFDFDGVHLGKQDMNPSEARNILGPGKIIGATANTFEEIQRLSEMPVDYIGLGPYRFTTTKQNLSPVLGLEGYRSIMKEMKDHAIQIPVIAIGGILPEDIKPLIHTGVHGIAVSSGIHAGGNFFENAVKYLEELKEAL